MSLVALVALAWLLVPLAPVAVRVAGRFAGWPLAAGLGALALATLAVPRADGVAEAAVPWIPALDVAVRLRLDGLSLLFALLVLGIGAVVLAYSTSYLRAPRSPGFYALMTGFAAAMLTLVLADDLVLLFVAWELTTLASYLLILRSGPAAKAPATRTLLVTVFGGLCLLAAVVATIVRTGTTTLTDALASDAWAADPVFATLVAVLVAVAAMTKSAQFPFHAWLPDAMVAPAPVSAYLHAAAMVKAGIYLLLRFAPAASESPAWAPTLVAVGLVTTLYGGFLATRRDDLKALLAMSTVSHLGLLVAVIGIGTPEAMLAASAHVVAHALFKSSAFMATGLIERRTGTRDARELRGLWRAMPGDAAMIALAAASMAGVIPLLGFVSKELVLEAALHPAGGEDLGLALALTIAAGASLTVWYSARFAVPGPLAGRRRGRRRPAEAAPWRGTATMSVMVAATAIAGLAAGVAAPAAGALVAPAASVAAGGAEVGSLALWHGPNLPLALSTAAIVAGVALALARARRPVAPAATREPRVSGVRAVEGFQAGAIALGRRVGDLTRFDSPAANLAAPVALIGLAALALPALWRGLPEFAGPVRPFDLVLLALVGAGTIALIVARTRLGAVIAIGAVGFGIVLWFFALGASDVAMTQLVVEVLTVVVIVLVLRRMPARFGREPRGRRPLAAVAAVASGVVATVVTLVFTGHRDLSDAAGFFLREAEELTGGTNVVNTILVDFRALDTLGELVVLGICAVAVATLLDARPLLPTRTPAAPATALADADANAVFLRTGARVLLPLLAAASAIALLRGHNAPGGGFIAALLGAAAIALVYLGSPRDRLPRLASRAALPVAGAGVVIAVLTGLAGLLDGSFLRPLHLDVLGYHLTTALVFDLGVYLAVFGVILTAVVRLGTPTAAVDPSPARDRSRA